ncbi:MAG TPA: penicillin-binding transpeptidase domain-containing protein, partial [Candidatus Atribacteria bacterium]|nr:penicillin-binding transpeptidase domain-containing protein [Candidatus Atribacteria bacterium]
SVFSDLDPSITLGGKTGTAETVPNTRERNTAWFALFTSYEDPKVVMVIAIPNGGGSSNATPVARRMIEEYYRLKNEEIHNDLPGSNDITP